MKVKCICGNKFQANLGKVKCRKCLREYHYSNITQKCDIDYDTGVYYLDDGVEIKTSIDVMLLREKELEN